MHMSPTRGHARRQIARARPLVCTDGPRAAICSHRSPTHGQRYIYCPRTTTRQRIWPTRGHRHAHIAPTRPNVFTYRLRAATRALGWHVPGNASICGLRTAMRIFIWQSYSFHQSCIRHVCPGAMLIEANTIRLNSHITFCDSRTYNLNLTVKVASLELRIKWSATCTLKMQPWRSPGPERL